MYKYKEQALSLTHTYISIGNKILTTLNTSYTKIIYQSTVYI